MKILTTLTALCIAISYCSSQELYVKKFHDVWDYTSDIIPTNDNGYMMLLSHAGDENYANSISKMDSNYNTQWTKLISKNMFIGNEYQSIIQLQNDDYLLAGLSQYGGSIILGKYDPEGNIIWSKKINLETSNYYFANIYKLNNEESVIVLDQTIQYRPSFTILKINNNDGHVVWSEIIAKNLAFVPYVEPRNLLSINDSEFIIVGSVMPDFTGKKDRMFILKMDASGNIIWSRTSDAAPGMSASNIIKLQDNNYLLSGYYVPNNKTGFSTLLLTLSDSGTFISGKSLKVGYDNFSVKLLKAQDGGFVLAGGALDAANVFKSGPYLLKLSDNYEIEWSKLYFDDSLNRHLRFITQNKSGIFLAQVYDEDDYYSVHNLLMNIDVSGNACYSYNINSSEDSVNFSFDDSPFKNLSFSANIEERDDSVLSYIQNTDTICSSILPLQLLSFVARSKYSNNLLKWRTANELNTSRFEIERCADGKNFIGIGSVSAVYTAVNLHDYSFTDVHPLPFKNYYRLKIIDKNGAYTFSEVRLVEGNKSLNVQIYPNPVQSILGIKLTCEKAMDVQIKVVSTEGKIIMEQKKNIQPGSTVINMSAASLNAGIYFLKVSTPSENFVIQFVKA